MKTQTAPTVNAAVTLRAIEFMAKNPTLIAQAGGFDFYEHPTLGDEATLRAVTPNGRVIRTDFWDAPDVATDSDVLAEMKRDDQRAWDETMQEHANNL